MKIKILLLVLFILPFVTCKEKSTPEADTLEINTKNLSFDENGGIQYVRLTSNAGWTVSADNVPWMECVPSSGTGDDRVQIKTTLNNTSNVRTATITFKTAGGTTSTVDVSQATTAPYIGIRPELHQVTSAGEEITVDVSANRVWNVEIASDAQSWISQKSKTETNAVLNVTANNTENDRSSSVIFRLTDSNISASLALSQKSISSTATIELSPKNATTPPEGGNVSVSVSSAGIAWNIGIPEADTWVTVKEKTNNRAVFAVSENLTGAIRTSNITFTSDNGKATAMFVLTQDKGYALMTSLTPNASLEGKLHNDLDTYVRNYGADYSENPHCTGGYGGHDDGIHLAVEKDETLNRYVFRFDIHIDPVIDGDRCSSSTTDRQRNELKTATNNTTWAKVQGNYDEWQVLEWKFKLPAGFQPTSSFCHIHQIKAQDGPNNSSPVITITPRANSNGSNKRMQIIHSIDGGTGTALGTFVDNIPLSDFEEEWVQVREEIHYTHSGYYSCKITRIRDGKELLDVERNNIDMWRKGASYIRSKYGIYRSLAGGDLSKNPVGQSSLLKNESIRMCDFKIYEKNSNPNPGATHD